MDVNTSSRGSRESRWLLGFQESPPRFASKEVAKATRSPGRDCDSASSLDGTFEKFALHLMKVRLPLHFGRPRRKVYYPMHNGRAFASRSTTGFDPKCRLITDGILKSRRKFVSFDRVSARLDWQALVRHPLTHGVVVGVVVNGDIRLPPPTRHRVEQRRPLPRPPPGGVEAVEGVAAGIRVL
jgi:hypothetical protein